MQCILKMWDNMWIAYLLEGNGKSQCCSIRVWASLFCKFDPLLPFLITDFLDECLPILLLCNTAFCEGVALCCHPLYVMVLIPVIWPITDLSFIKYRTRNVSLCSRELCGNVSRGKKFGNGNSNGGFTAVMGLL